MPVDPSTLSGKVLWLRAKDQAGAGGSSVTAWADQSGTGNNFTAVNSPAPTVVAAATPAGGKAVQFPAGGQVDCSTPTPPVSAAASSQFPSETAPSAIDGNATTYWTTNGVVAAWLRLALRRPHVVTGYTIRRRDDIPNRNPKTWTFEGTNDATFSSWTVLDTRTGITWPTAGQSQTFTFTNATAYQWYRINITANNGDASYTSIAELSLSGLGAEMWIVIKSTGGGVNGSWHMNGVSQRSHYPYSDGVIYEAFGQAGGDRQSWTPTVPLTSWRLYRVANDGVTWQAWLDNATQATAANKPVAWYPSTWNLGADIGASGSAGLHAQVAEVLIRDAPSTPAEAADLITYFNTEHGLTVPGGSSGATSGSVAAVAGSPTLTVPGAVTRTGTVAATAQAPSLAVAGDLPTPGTVAATAPAPTVAVTGVVAGIVSGAVAATAAAPTLGVAGDVTAPISGTVAATAPTPQVSVTDSVSAAVVALGLKVETGALTILNLVALPGTEVPIALGVETGDTMPVVPLPGTSVQVGLSLITRPVEAYTPDPRHKRPQWRYVITDLANAPLGELTDLEHDPVEDGIGEPATMDFTIPTGTQQAALIKPIERQCQVWDGNRLRLRGPILPGRPSDDGTSVTHTVHDPSWFWRDGRRVITRTPRKNLLRNGDFKQDLTWWTRGYDDDSKPKAAPKVVVVGEDFSDDTDGLDPIKAAQITGVESYTESELASNAVFWPNLATFRPGGKESIEAVANAMPTTAGLKVTVIGHTANDGTGSGLGLSKRRADAAAAVIKAKRPGAVITTKGVGFYDPKPGFPINSQEQRRVVIQYDQTITGESKQWMRQTVEVTQPKAARYPLELTAAAMLKVADDWSVPDANMVSVKVVARRKGVDGNPDAKLPWNEQLGIGTASISDTDPVDRWIPQTASATVPADGRPYVVDVYLYAPAALAKYTAVGLFPEEELYFWGVDQALIFKGIMEHIQKPEFGYADLGVGVRAPLTGVRRDREFMFRDLTPADTALDGLAGISRGLEWDTVTTATTTTATTYYPRQGKTVGYVLALGSNLTSAVPANTRDIGSAVIAQAQGLGSYRAEAYASDRRAFGGTLIQRVVTAEQDTPLNELGETAKAELFWARSSTPAYWVDVDPDSIADVLAHTGKGDTVRLILDEPEPVDQLARIVRRQIHPDGLRLMLAFEEV